MSRLLLLYGVFILVALGLLYWRLSKLDHRPKTLDEIRQMGDRVAADPRDLPRPFPYDLSGRIAAFRLYPISSSDAQPRQPLFWLKGSLNLVIDDDWSDGLCRFKATTVSREDLDHLMRDLMALEDSPQATLELEQRDENGLSSKKLVDAAPVRALIEDVTSDRTLKSYRPQGVLLSARARDAATQAPVDAMKWPLQRNSLKEILESETTVITRHADIDKLLALPATEVIFEQGELKAVVSLEVLPDRP